MKEDPAPIGLAKSKSSLVPIEDAIAWGNSVGTGIGEDDAETITKTFLASGYISTPQRNFLLQLAFARNRIDLLPPPF